MCKALCTRCGDYFVGVKGLRTHQSVGNKCIRTQIERGLYVPPAIVPAIAPQVPEVVRDVPGDGGGYAEFFVPNLPPNEGGADGNLNLTHIEGHSLTYLDIPANLLQNLRNEQPVDGRYQSLIQFALNATAAQRQQQSGAAAILLKTASFLLSSAFWGARLGSIGFMGYALYYSYTGECSATINYIFVAITKGFVTKQ